MMQPASCSAVLSVTEFVNYYIFYYILTIRALKLTYFVLSFVCRMQKKEINCLTIFH